MAKKTVVIPVLEIPHLDHHLKIAHLDVFLGRSNMWNYLK